MAKIISNRLYRSSSFLMLVLSCIHQPLSGIQCSFPLKGKADSVQLGNQVKQQIHTDLLSCHYITWYSVAEVFKYLVEKVCGICTQCMEAVLYSLWEGHLSSDSLHREKASHKQTLNFFSIVHLETTSSLYRKAKFLLTEEVCSIGGAFITRYSLCLMLSCSNHF